MTETAARGRSRLSTAVVIVGSIFALIVGAFVISNLDSYIVMDRGKLSVPRLAKEVEVNARDLPALVEALSGGSEDVRYAALIFSASDRPSEQDVLNLQFSFENGKVGFDWVLLAPRNIEDQEKFRAFAREHGVEPVSLTMNGVSYIRVEDTDVAKFASLVMTEMYSLPPDRPLGLVYQGFDWPQR
jgi:hypothetical protein